VPAGALFSAPKPAESRLAAKIGRPTKMARLFRDRPFVCRCRTLRWYRVGIAGDSSVPDAGRSLPPVARDRGR